jgi:hypothetical protein
VHEAEGHIEGDRSDAAFGTHGPPAAFTKATGEHHGLVQNSCGFGILVRDDEFADVLNNITEATRLSPRFVRSKTTELSAILGDSTTIRRTSSTVLMPTEVNVRRQQ